MSWPLAVASGLGAVLGFFGSRDSNARNVREAEKNREFQERMSSTAHQREVEDLKRAGLNPMLSAHGGASSPSGDRAEVESPIAGAGRGVASALAVKQAMANIDLTRAQERKTNSEDLDIRVKNAEYQETFMERREIVASQLEFQKATNDEKRRMLPHLLRKAKEEIQLTISSADRARAVTALDQASLKGAQNIEAFEKSLGEAGPWVKFFFEAMRQMQSNPILRDSR